AIYPLSLHDALPISRMAQSWSAPAFFQAMVTFRVALPPNPTSAATMPPSCTARLQAELDADLVRRHVGQTALHVHAHATDRLDESLGAEDPPAGGHVPGAGVRDQCPDHLTVGKLHLDQFLVHHDKLAAAPVPRRLGRCPDAD